MRYHKANEIGGQSQVLHNPMILGIGRRELSPPRPIGRLGVLDSRTFNILFIGVDSPALCVQKLHMLPYSSIMKKRKKTKERKNLESYCATYMVFTGYIVRR